MKNSKIVTPVLLYLMILLLCIAVYFNFAFKPLQSKIDEVSMKNELVKNQRMEIELAMIKEETIKEDIEEVKALLSEDDYILLNGEQLADDINKNAKATGIDLNDIVIAAPEKVLDTASASKSLIALPAEIGFEATYEKAVEFIKSFEKSNTGAYLVNTLDVSEKGESLLQWKLSLKLYFYDNPDIVPINIEGDDSETSGNEVWTQ